MLYFEGMEREVQSQFDEIWAILRKTAERGEQAEIRFNRRMDRAEKRMDLADKRMDRAEQRAELADKRIQATRKLVEAGMKIVMRDRADIRALCKRMDAFLRSARNGHNGNGHGPKGSR